MNREEEWSEEHSSAYLSLSAYSEPAPGHYPHPAWAPSPSSFPNPRPANLGWGHPCSDWPSVHRPSGTLTLPMPLRLGEKVSGEAKGPEVNMLYMLKQQEAGYLAGKGGQSSGLAWSTRKVPGHLGLHGKTWIQNKQTLQTNKEDQKWWRGSWGTGLWWSNMSPLA